MAIQPNLLPTFIIGTNLDLFLLIWTILSGRLLSSRGGVISALSLFGLPKEAVRRAWAALARGSWRIADLTHALERAIMEEGRWKPSDYGGLRSVAADVTAFFRPKLPEEILGHRRRKSSWNRLPATAQAA